MRIDTEGSPVVSAPNESNMWGVDSARAGAYLQCVARIRCTNPDCGHDYFRPFSCNGFYLCPSCSQKRTLLFAEYLAEEVLHDLPHRQFVFKGGFDHGGTFFSIPFSGLEPMVDVFRRRVVWILVEKELLSEDFARNMLSWRNSGFSIDYANWNVGEFFLHCQLEDKRKGCPQPVHCGKNTESSPPDRSYPCVHATAHPALL